MSIIGSDPLAFLAADARLTQQEILKGAADPVAQVGRFTDHTIKEEAVGVGEGSRCQKAGGRVNHCFRHPGAIAQQIQQQIGHIIAGACDAIEQP